MHPTLAPITGREDREGVPPPLGALIDFYEAFNTRSLERMAENWAQTDEVVMNNPLGGMARGWEQIKAVYERLFHGPVRVTVEFYDYALHSTTELCYAVGRERGEARVGETVIALNIRTTRIYRVIDGCWRQVHHHGSIDDPDLLARYQAAVNPAPASRGGVKGRR